MMGVSPEAVLLDFDWTASYVLATDRLSTAAMNRATARTVSMEGGADGADTNPRNSGGGMPLLQLAMDVARVAPPSEVASISLLVSPVSGGRLRLLATASSEVQGGGEGQPAERMLLPNDRLTMELDAESLDALIAALRTAVDGMDSLSGC
ncbi:hypothetical protein TcCL_NonESM02316 [Trypanosoma cruzi]|uniref:COMM domain-containing protein n=1 Tax=Trypanosoma cruzi (strain CL Brener) TaxID=353153 RepID=Q4DG84_TRYCC|nr:hypothetical protein Tc00.1047053506201.60 [Trypanosoma cruzi]EAN91527.1 hypothetical protein Tc00.1047053506201.60 [Trypanosoma cruzi]RNC47723.1 hypothetical protein TcCL_NonESM02316 [Trypanosoma cruzi]|eukprot:XP_813378.1 hypothetical protein [Trypanosoma cruzi strain CL Brener]